MWEKIFFYFPEWEVFLQAFTVFFIPYAISKFFGWVRDSDKDGDG